MTTFSFIVLPAAPTAVEKSAASELADGLQRITGQTFPICSETAPQPGAAFYIGATAVAARVRSQENIAVWRPDEILIRAVPEGLVLTGDAVRGPLYAVCTYLEDTLGVRWWTSDASTYPARPVVKLPAADLRYAPPLKYRESYYLDGFDPLLKVRSKVNYSSAARYEPATPVHPFIPPELGGNYRLYFFEGRHSAYHSFFEILPPDKYFEKHPEWYSLVGGKRSAQQLCLSNKEMLGEYVAETCRRLREMPEANFIQVSQNDVQGACECEACRAIEAEEGGTHSGIYLRFVNAVAAEIEKEFPNVMVDTFAYQFTRSAPLKVRPRKNVLIRLCDIECAFNKPLTEFEENRAFLKDLADWSRVAPGQIFIWDYLANFRSYMLPHPNLYSIAPNIRAFVDAGAVGVFEQGDAGCIAGEFAALRFWLVAHLLWNPKADEKKLIADFIEGYYGKKAAPHIAEYIRIVNGAGATADKPMRCYHVNVTDWLSPETRTAAVAEMAAALKAAEEEGAAFARRVRREQLSTDHMRILNWEPEDGDRQAVVAHWTADCRSYGVITAAETVDPGQFEKYAATLLG